MIRYKARRAESVHPSGGSNFNHVKYTDKEVEHIRREINLLRTPPDRPLGGSPAMRNLLSIPAEDVYDRVFQFATVYQLPQALILSGCLESALHPLDEREYEGKETLCHICNLLVQGMAIISLTNSCTITWGIANITSMPRETAHLSIAYSGKFVYVEMLSALLAMLVMATLCVGAHLRMPLGVA